MLAILACAQVKSIISNLSMTQIIRLGTLLRCPPLSMIFKYHSTCPLISKFIDAKEGRLIAEFIIPAVNKLRLKFSIKFTNMFSYALLLDYHHPMYILSNDFVSSDRFFDSIAFKFVLFCFLIPT